MTEISGPKGEAMRNCPNGVTVDPEALTVANVEAEEWMRSATGRRRYVPKHEVPNMVRGILLAYLEHVAIKGSNPMNDTIRAALRASAKHLCHYASGPSSVNSCCQRVNRCEEEAAKIIAEFNHALALSTTDPAGFSQLGAMADAVIAAAKEEGDA